MPRKSPLLLRALIALCFSTTFCAAQELTLTPFNTTGIYKLNEKAGWTVALPNGASPKGKYTYTLKKNNFDTIKSGDLDLVSGKATIEISLDEPAMLYLEIKAPRAAGNSSTTKPSNKPIVAGAAIAPTQLKPVATRPADFDAFWESKIKLLKSIPENAVLTPHDIGNPKIEYAIIKMDHLDGHHVYGQLAKPAKPGKYPALLMLQWASPPYPLDKSWITGYAAAGWIALDIEPHDVLPDQPKSYYDAIPQRIKNYASIGNDDRDKSYFLAMYLADYRAVDYLAGRPDWDGKTLLVIGTSMGGQQGLAVTGLHPAVTHLIVNEPGGCDTNAQLHGRQEGYPNFPSSPKVMEPALYFDTVNFAPHITARSLVAMGFVDTTCPPAGVWTAFNQIKAPKEAVPMIDSPHNHLATPAQQRPYTKRSAEWLDTLVKGGEVEPAGPTTP